MIGVARSVGVRVLALCLVPAVDGAQLPPTGSDSAPKRAAPCAGAVVDGTRARVRLHADGTLHTGTARGWATPTPRLVSAHGDTIDIHPEDRRDLSAGKTGRSTLAGGIIGWLVGTLSNVPCLGERTCGEQNPIPALGTAVGLVIGHQIRRERWIRVSSDTACAATLR